MIGAPTNLGLRPPVEGSVPGCYKARWALEEAGVFVGVDVRDGGTAVPPRYEAAWSAGDGVRNAGAMAAYSELLADRLAGELDRGELVVVVGGDCSVLIGICLGLRARGRFGLVFCDGHSDFRHPGNSPAIGAAAGEDLAIVTGRGDDRLVNLGGLGPYVSDEDVAVIGTRDQDDHVGELEHLGIPVWPADRLRHIGALRVVDDVLGHMSARPLDGFWLHLDVDVLHPDVMPAVDSPTPGGVTMEELEIVVGRLLSDPRAAGVDNCVFDPDLDPTGR